MDVLSEYNLKTFKLKFIFVFLLLRPFTVTAQESDVRKLNIQSARTSKTANGWIALDSGWRFKTGDNPEWALPDFDDSSWQPINLFSVRDSLAITKNNITWIRLRIKNDSTFSQPLIMRIYQSGASEIYLDGKLIHQLGKVSSNPDSVEYFDPATDNLSFPLVDDTIQTLAIRFINLPQSFPIYSKASFLEPWVTTFENGRDDYVVQYFRKQKNLTHAAAGVAVLLWVLFLSLYLFFPAQKVNLYFALSNLSFLLYLILALLETSYRGDSSWLFRLQWLFTWSYFTLSLSCIYKIFQQKLGWAYWGLVIAICTNYLVGLFVNSYADNFLIGLVVADMLRICIRSLKTNKAGAFIMLVSAGIIFAYWICAALSEFSVILDISLYGPLAYLILPLGLAIYLGYDFGKVSQSLRRKLVEVEQLSHEKQQILSAQNVTLEKQVQKRTSALNQSLEDLKSTNSLLQRQREVTELQKRHVEEQNEIIQAENKRKTIELEEARRLQLAMLPKDLPKLPHLEIAVYMKTATEVGGDYYDFHVAEDGTLTAVVGDATGHGLKAGTMVTVAKSLFSSLAKEPDMVATFRAMSASIRSMNLPLLSMCLAMLKINNGTMQLSSAGIPPVLIYRSSAKTIEEVAISGVPLGAMKRFPYREKSVPLESGDTILLMTDGFPERMNDREQMFDYPRANAAFKKVARKSPQEIVEYLVRSCDDWANGRPQDDDVTFVVIKRAN